jgi:LCP family protein required for cell wall assembly
MKDHNQVDFLQKENKHQQSNKTKKTTFFSIIGLGIILLFSGAVFAAMPSNSFGGSNNFADNDLTPANPTENIIQKVGGLVFSDKKNKIERKKNKRLNFLLLGMGGPGHDGPYLTDTIIIGSVKPKTGEVAMVSIPRDLRVKIPDAGYHKINYVNAYGESKRKNWGAAYTTNLIEDKFDLNIDYYLRVDFAAFKEVVDKINGIKVTVKHPFTDNQFPAKNEKYKTISFSRGVQTMNGQTALNFARSRHGNNGQGSDFARARRQQKVLLAAKRKLMSYDTITSPQKIKGILDSVEKNITTNMKFSDIVSLAELSKKINIKQAKTLVLDNGKNGLLEAINGPNGAFMLKPKSGNFDKISTEIKNIFSSDKAQNVKLDKNNSNTKKLNLGEINKQKTNKTNIEVQNGTWSSGLAAETKQKLVKTGLTVNEIKNTNKKPLQQSAIYKIDQKDIKGKKLSKLTKKLKIPIEEQHRPGIDIASSTDILVILGRDYTK